MADALASEVPANTKARSARMTENCPDCGSTNYFRPHGVGNAMAQCYECGYNPRFSHSTAGAGIPSDAGAATPAKQLNPKGLSNFNPQNIVAHI
jgi:predicted nucleic-acid-binding Zn-ribbon protein